MRHEYRWNDWNIEKCEKHNVRPADAEYVVDHASRPFPRRTDDDKRLVWGRTIDGQYLQVIFLVDPDDCIFIIHAMPMTDRQKRQLNRRKR